MDNISTYHDPNVFYQALNTAPAGKPRKGRFSRAAKLLALSGVALFMVSYAPSAWYMARSAGQRVVDFYIIESGLPENTSNVPSVVSPEDVYQPPRDRSLMPGGYLAIPSIGVKTTIHEAPFEEHEEALKKGIWRFNNYGTPYERQLPTIVVAHRYGYKIWDNTYRRENSFYNLPKLAKGDLVEIVWQQRKYTYAITDESLAPDMDTSIEADLILYTCRDLVSDMKYFKYAKLLEL